MSSASPARPPVMIDLRPATERLTRLITAITEEDFSAPTPCPGVGLGDLIDHVGGFAVAFTAAARKERGDTTQPPPPPSAAHLGVGWRERIPRDLAILAEAWRAPDAWEGVTTVAGVEMPASAMALVALDELVVHGWDIAVASAQPYEPEVAEVEAVMSWITSFDPPRDGSLFGPVVPVPDDAPALDRLLGLAGRDPHWKPPT
jgi:uncharacterized protein (TIGR03086 family)